MKMMVRLLTEWIALLLWYLDLQVSDMREWESSPDHVSLIMASFICIKEAKVLPVHNNPQIRKHP